MAVILKAISRVQTRHGSGKGKLAGQVVPVKQMRVIISPFLESFKRREKRRRQTTKQRRRHDETKKRTTPPMGKTPEWRPRIQKAPGSHLRDGGSLSRRMGLEYDSKQFSFLFVAFTSTRLVTAVVVKVWRGG
ncbi:uncharacterized protein LOC131320520 [Rhododendron vialii]|uniref:uncharacterized protein LOC131320520 n=1 Tax=Rhododendron vialii TaxID=182163 RepID=UPI00265FBC0E|nr:uncharacterized protein LOC131320520 [Rhododendron vialii]